MVIVVGEDLDDLPSLNPLLDLAGRVPLHTGRIPLFEARRRSVGDHREPALETIEAADDGPGRQIGEPAFGHRGFGTRQPGLPTPFFYRPPVQRKPGRVEPAGMVR